MQSEHLINANFGSDQHRNVIETEIDRLNLAIRDLMADETRRRSLIADWQSAALEAIVLTSAQQRLVRTLPERGIRTIQYLVRSIMKEGGRIHLSKESVGTVGLSAEIVSQQARTINIKICKFDANFRNCKWFPH
jgi:hypothetical protein